MRAIVIGGGFGGLASAALLAKRGYEVVLVEKNCRLGGRSVLYDIRGHRVEIGPTWYLMDDVIDKVLGEIGGRTYEVAELNPSMMFVDRRHGKIEVGRDLPQRLEELERGAGDRSVELMREAGRLYQVVVEHMLLRKYETWLDMLSAAKAGAGFAKYLVTSFGSLVERRFKSPLIQRLLEYDIMFLGSPPRELPALYGLLLNYSVFVRGVKAPKGGFAAVIRNLIEAGARLGVDFRTCTAARRILVEGGKVRGVETASGVLESDVVVVNADYKRGEELLEPRYRSYGEAYWGRVKMAPSAYMALLSGDRWEGPPHLIYISEWERHLSALTGGGDMPQLPSFYLHVPSVVEPDWAPPGRSSMFILVPSPPGVDYWPRGLAEKLAAEATGGSAETLAEFPSRFFCDYYGAYQCTALGPRHTLRQTALGRPLMRGRMVRGLYFVGQYTHSGIGVPSVLASAYILARYYV
ncbi:MULTISPECIES: NAD(P)/FAD-dependent oxidoreductase [Pyrobaculum]|uniref:NAD(P)/FAD-dependent oxidoreductase n=1 Tax=Pyrobaculum arsenaticum TaxID=121277 RepID=A0A7L4P7N1_9CREN|nr:NAD(P)/FAD-dependent oxidoreductase [Pyrobaculum arsenaticum]MCY0890228.1 NAD(P)/FAD-dependent oxidoreductase [Pyrobaculum arsenaticum]NYR15021.1 NAD(P)/FAD-dependent oxidoreductase [Pyrobaculum arsenaticum]